MMISMLRMLRMPLRPWEFPPYRSLSAIAVRLPARAAAAVKVAQVPGSSLGFFRRAAPLY
jgi:hypothetical protein